MTHDKNCRYGELDGFQVAISPCTCPEDVAPCVCETCDCGYIANAVKKERERILEIIGECELCLGERVETWLDAETGKRLIKKCGYEGCDEIYRIRNILEANQ